MVLSDAFFQKQRLLVIAPHPDDEILGCGGLITKIKKNNGKVFVMYMTNGQTTEFSSNGITTPETRLSEIKKVTKFLSVDDWDIAFPDGKYHLKLDAMPLLEIISKIERESTVSIERVKPTIIACPHTTDYNQDHRRSAEATIAATRPAPNTHKSLTSLIIGYEFTATINWGIEPFLSQNLVVTLNKEMFQKKIESMKLYKTQVRETAHTRSLENMEALARIRGAMAGSEFAESFHVYRWSL